VAVNRGRFLIIEPVERPLLARDAYPRGLLWQRYIKRFVRRMKYDFRLGTQFLKTGDAADVIHVRVRQGNRLQAQFVTLQNLYYKLCFVARVYADCQFRLRASEDARLLLKWRDCEFF
jgi:hypothetical protein